MTSLSESWVDTAMFMVARTPVAARYRKTQRAARLATFVVATHVDLH
jgi:hypothetical protein